ncbi:tetraspanin-32 isoform X9 [Oryctolagus cuniculus]|uniref:tetraspanin-32 isoform X9 n=1 Tax=Oryctolagus cuniculus TaxID=9986 RepID=UPI0038794306
MGGSTGAARGPRPHKPALGTHLPWPLPGDSCALPWPSAPWCRWSSGGSTTQPSTGGGGRAGHLRPGVRPGAEDHVWRLAAGAGGHPGRGHRCLWCLSFPIRPARLGAWRATASPWARSQFLCCGKRSPFSFLERTGANHCHGAGAPREPSAQDCLEGIRSFLWTQQKVDLALLSTALALTVHALLLSSFLWFAIRTCRGLHRRGKYALTPRQPPPESVLPLQSRR